jgi:NAD(P)-dependent dehydrogenase (short-subunit alcohol dehydrogenase family)
MEQILPPQHRHRLIYAVRSVGKMENILANRQLHSDTDSKNGTRASVLPLDLSSLKSVQDFATAVLPKKMQDIQESEDRKKPLKVVLINNAGQAWLPEKTLTEDGYEMQFQSNVLGHYLLTRLLMNQKKLERVVHVSSLAHACGVVPGYSSGFEELGSGVELGTHFSPATYCDTKLMNNLFSNYLSTNHAVKSVALHPGVVHTAIMRHTGIFQMLDSVIGSFYGRDGQGQQTGKSSSQPDITDFLVTIARRMTRATYIPAEESANTMLFSIFNVNTANIVEDVPYIADMKHISQCEKALDKGAQEYLWNTAEKYVAKWL